MMVFCNEDLAIIVLVTLSCSRCHSEPPWCAVSLKDTSNTLVYPPIARAERVQGVVVMRMVYVPNGMVMRTELVFGPAMLSASLTRQLLEWTLKTDAVGNDECMTLLIAEFRFHDPGQSSRLQQHGPAAPGILRASLGETTVELNALCNRHAVSTKAGYQIAVLEFRGIDCAEGC